MASTNLMYDKSAYEQRLKQSMGVGDYVLSNFANNKCEMQNNIVGGNDVSRYSGNITDLESDLYGITRRLSSCSKSRYNPSCNCWRCRNSMENGLPCDCPSCSRMNLTPLSKCSAEIVGERRRVSSVGNFVKPSCDSYGSYNERNGLFDWIASWFS